MKRKPKFRVGQVVALKDHFMKVTKRTWETHFETFFTWTYWFGNCGYSEELLRTLTKRERGKP